MKNLLLAFTAAILSFTLLAAGIFFLPSVASATETPAMTKQQAQAFKLKVMSHVTPMPPLMSIAKKHADVLELTAEQRAKMNEWAQKSAPLVGANARQVMQAEKEIADATLAGESAEKINALVKSMMDTRLAIINTKLKCRDNLKGILTDVQWAKLIEMHKKMNAA